MGMERHDERLTYGRTCVYNLNYHIVWGTKCRNKVLTEQIEKDLYDNYFSVIKNLALYDFAQIGAPFESSHSENSISRNWVNRDEIFKGVHSFVQVL